MPTKMTKISDKDKLVPNCTLGKDGRFRNPSKCGKGECDSCGWYAPEVERRKQLLNDGHSFRRDAYGARRLYLDLGLKLKVEQPQKQ